MAMEFAITAPVMFTGADDSWQPSGARSFCLVNGGPFARPPWRARDWSDNASCADRDLWRSWHTGAVWTARPRANSYGKHVSLRHSAHQFVRLLPARLDRPVHAQSHGYFAGLARGHRRRLLRRLHYLLQLRLGNRQNAGRRRVAPRLCLRRRQRRSRLALVRRRNPPGKPFLVSTIGHAVISSAARNLSWTPTRKLYDPPKIRRRAHPDAHPHRRIRQMARQTPPRSHRGDAAQRRLLRCNRAARRRRLRRLKHLSHRQAAALVAGP